MIFEDWLKLGYAQGWCGPPVCVSHDGVPVTEAESDDDEPCVHILRLYEDDAVKSAVEDNHSPSVWRASNRNL